MAPHSRMFLLLAEAYNNHDLAPSHKGNVNIWSVTQKPTTAGEVWRPATDKW